MIDKNLIGNRSGGEEIHSKIYDDYDDGDDDDDDDDDDHEFYIPKETPRDIMPDLESEESAEQRRKKGHGLKILTP